MTASGVTTPVPPLRRYQREAAAAIARSVIDDRGLSFSVQMSRQSGKNEVSARVEQMLMGHFAAQNLFRNGVKCAPTLEPQCVRSLERLVQKFEERGLGAAVETDGMRVRFGRASMSFLSADPESNVVGDTANLMLEVDEAQDVQREKFDKDFRPMAASTAATTVYYGTPWADDSLLEEAKQHHLELERKDGIKRHFEVSWERVAEEVPAYKKYVEGELLRLGATHPLFLTQYAMKTLPGLGRLFNATDLAVLQGTHARLDAAVQGEHYVAGLDVGGSGAVSVAGAHDSTVLTIGRVYSLPGVGDEPRLAVDIVRQYSWTGTPIAQLWGAILQLVDRTWSVGKMLIDATGLGESAAEYFMRALGPTVAQPFKFTLPSKSELGYGLLAAVRGGRCRLHGADGSVEHATLTEQLVKARAEYLPNKLMRWYVNEEDGHDDNLVSLALCVEAMKGGEPRIARGRRDG